MDLFEILIHIRVWWLTNETVWEMLFLLFPFILLIELPFNILLVISILKLCYQNIFEKREQHFYFPAVTFLVTCYSEGRDIRWTLRSLAEQVYPGSIEIFVIVDGAKQNQHTYKVAQYFAKNYPLKPNCAIKVIPKLIRGGHASSLNLGLQMAKGELVVIMDGDCSCDNDMLISAVRNFTDANVVGISGTLRVRNAKKNLLTVLQSLEYMLGIHFFRIGLGNLKALNVISSAFGVFRKDFLIKVGGWKNGSAEDLDLTLRIQAYFHRHPGLRLLHDPFSISHTQAPENFFRLLKQRLRWDGDIFYIYCRRHWRVLRPKFLGWAGFFGLIWFVLLIHLVMPFLITISFIYFLLAFKVNYFLAVLAITYGYYLIIIGITYVIHLLLVSERKQYDLSFAPFLLLFPAYQFIMRIWSVVALISEMILKSHKDSTMAPWWVNRKVD